MSSSVTVSSLRSMMPTLCLIDEVVVLSFLQDLTLKDLTSVTSLLSLVGSTQVQAGKKTTLTHTAVKHKTL